MSASAPIHLESKTSYFCLQFSKFLSPTTANISRKQLRRSVHSEPPSKIVNLESVRRLLPKLETNLRKGECGRVGVIGGSSVYTGAPYFSAMTALRVGCDMVHVFCPPEAAPVIKSYSPELMVHPSYTEKTLAASMHRLDSLVIGPGLGRDPGLLQSVIKPALQLGKLSHKPIIIDADAIILLSNDLNLIRGYAEAILTPNYREFLHLYRAAFGDQELSETKIENGDAAMALANYLGCSVFQKGAVDHIACGTSLYLQKRFGAPRRCGGQGDLLNGALAVFCLWSIKRKCPDPMITGGFAASELVRCAAQESFKRLGRSSTTTDILNEIPALIGCNEFRSSQSFYSW